MSDSQLINLGLVLLSTILLAAAILLLSIYKRLFISVKNLWFRRNLAVLCIAVLFMFALVTLVSPELRNAETQNGGIMNLFLRQLIHITIIVLFVFNTVWLIARIPRIRSLSFVWHHVIIVLSIVVSALIIFSILNYVTHGMKFNNLHTDLRFSYYNSLVTGLIYTAFNYVELDRKRKLNEKELEVTRLMAQKTKAELDALHSKVNPHFLYNALNSIADLSITDGKKARKMTIALADLFRYSINYSQNNFSTINDEVEMTEVYLQIEKIRFEDQLTYEVNVQEGLGHYLIPRFVLQPLVENAVKHGLKITGSMTEIVLDVILNEGQLVIKVYDNGPDFPAELEPGYGVKSVYDKFDLLFPGNYEIYFTNKPRKQVAIHIHKLMKNEDGL